MLLFLSFGILQNYRAHTHIPYSNPVLNSLDLAGLDVEPYLKNATLLAILMKDYDNLYVK